MPIRLTDDSWDQEISQHKGVALVNIWAPWCGPCRVIGPIIEELAKEYDGRAKIGKLNADENRKPGEFGVSGIPTLLFFTDGPPAGGKPVPEMDSVDGPPGSRLSGAGTEGGRPDGQETRTGWRPGRAGAPDGSGGPGAAGRFPG